ncbi:Arginine decarboxylase [Brevibacillus sp. IT-7CA2]
MGLCELFPKNRSERACIPEPSFLKGFQHPQYVITIKDITLDDYLNQNTQSRSFELLVPPIGLFDNRDQQKVLELLSFTNVALPVLVCSDDMDFSCTVVTRNVEEAKDCIRIC